MHWIAPAEKDTDNAALEKNLWDAADQFRANSGLKAQEYSGPILGLSFQAYGDRQKNKKISRARTLPAAKL